jgi:hypothetical protein
MPAHASVPPSRPEPRPGDAPAGVPFTERFQPLALLGGGAMGLVYRVRDLETATEVALKTLDSLDPEQLYHLKQEFRTLAAITHPNLVELYELTVGEAACFYTMELVEGVGFVAHARGDGRAARALAADELPRLVDAAEQLVLGLAAVHAAGKLHRDVKPSNVLVTRAGRVVLLDFGLAAACDDIRARAAASPELAGTVAYMAPEQAWGGATDPASDWYSAGVMLYETLTGRLPFEGPPARVLLDKAEAAPPPVRALAPAVPPDLAEVVGALLDPEPARRPAATDLLAALARCRARGPRAAECPRRAAGDTPFVGRAGERERLEAVRALVQEGRGAVVHVAGPSGIGKTELVRRVVSTLEQDGRTRVLRGRCHPQESVPYKALDAVVDALSRLLVGAEADVAALPPDRAAALVRLFPVLARVPGLAGGRAPAADLEPHEIRRRGFGALRALLSRLAARRPLVLWIDDLQWGDPDSAVFLREVLRPPEAPAMLLLLSYRSEDLTRVPFLAALLESHFEELPAGWTERLDLGPLSGGEARELARLLCGARLASERRLAAVAAESEGSPFLIAQLARHLAAVPGDAPVSLRLSEVVDDRVGRLQPIARRVVEVVSVAGRPLPRRLALEAAGLAERGRPVATALERECLLRSTTLGGLPAVEVYHDRIRETVVGRLAPEGVCRCHRRLADALEREADPNPEDLFAHYLGAGESGRAARYGLDAADRAARAMAFDRAARLYRQLLDLEVEGVERWELLARLAEAQANAGRGVDAAQSFERAAVALAARAPDAARVLALRRRAAEHYLRTGHLDEGIATTRDVLARVGVAFPSSPARALAAVVTQRLRLARRGLGFRLGEEAELPERTRLRLEACWGAAISFAVVDQLVGDALGVRHLREALDLGERGHLVRALGWEAAKSVQLGGRRMRRRAARILAVVERLAADADPYHRAWLHITRGTTAYEAAEWRRAHEECDAGLRIFRDHCTGVTWERVTFEAFSLSALAHMGELRALASRLPAAIGDADERGDVYAAIGLRAGVLSFVWLAQDRPGYARQQADDAIARWPATATFHVQHYLHLIAAVHTDLYRGDAWRAWRRMVEAWPRLRRALFLRLESPAIELRNLRARAALAAAAVTPGGLPIGGAPADRRWPRARLLRVARREARRLARADLPTGRPFARLIGAGIARIEGRAADAAQGFAAAASDLAALDMGLYAAAARMRAGALAGGAAGAWRARECAAWMREQDIRDPAAMAAVLCPVSG